MTLTKTIKIDAAALEVIGAMAWLESGTQVVGKLTGGQLERKLYEAVNKGLDALGGKWNRSKGGHVFTTDPRQQIAAMLDTGTVKVERDGFFRTPRAVVEQMLDMFERTIGERVLEPSAGDGAILDVLRDHHFHEIFAIEKNEDRRNFLRNKGYAVSDCTDFLTFTDKFPAIVMNPPFEQLQDVDHVMHAFNNCLSLGGELVSVMAESAFFRDDAKCVKFRELLDMHGYSERLNDGAFKESGTMVKTRLVYLSK